MWRSVRLHGDNKTEKSRRTLALPHSAVAALRRQRQWQAEARLAAGELWHDEGLVSVMSESGVAVEEIARLAGHSSSRTPRSSIATSCGRSSPPAPM